MDKCGKAIQIKCHSFLNIFRHFWYTLKTHDFVDIFSDTYVKLTLIAPNGKEVAHSKTSVRRGQPNPLFKENFMFQVALFQLADVTLMVSVYNKKSMKKKEMIGWFALGKHTFKGFH